MAVTQCIFRDEYSYTECMAYLTIDKMLMDTIMKIFSLVGRLITLSEKHSLSVVFFVEFWIFLAQPLQRTV